MTHDEVAKKCLVELAKHVFHHQHRNLTGLTYQELARRIGWFNQHDEPHSRLGKPLGRMGHLLQDINLGWEEGVPEIQALVVRKDGKNKNLPDDGINEFWKGYERLSRTEKEHKAHAEWQRIADFGSRWNTVLERLGLTSITNDTSTVRRFGSGGESPEHKRVKDFIARHPVLIGVHPGAEVFPEYALPSLDKIDLLFKEPTRWVAVEVKSSVSEGMPGDYERGIYQVIKYAAILNAMRSDAKHSVPKAINVILALETSLPEDLRTLTNTLSVTVFEQVTPVLE